MPPVSSGTSVMGSPGAGLGHVLPSICNGVKFLLVRMKGWRMECLGGYRTHRHSTYLTSPLFITQTPRRSVLQIQIPVLVPAIKNQNVPEHLEPESSGWTTDLCSTEDSPFCLSSGLVCTNSSMGLSFHNVQVPSKMSKIVPYSINLFWNLHRKQQLCKGPPRLQRHSSNHFSVLLEETNAARDHDLQLKMWFIPRAAKWHKTVTGEGQGRAMGQNTKGLVLARLCSSANLGKHWYSLILVLLNYKLALH